MTVDWASLDWTPLVSFPIEWAALSLLVAGAIYWERSALSGIGVEGCFLSALLGLCLAYEYTGNYGIAVAACVGGALVFALLASILLLSLRSLVARDRETTADLVAHIAEVDRRGIYGDAGYPSMRAYCL